jgi:hypothetical protein
MRRRNSVISASGKFTSNGRIAVFSAGWVALAWVIVYSFLSRSEFLTGGSKPQAQRRIYCTKVSIDTLVLVDRWPIPKYDGHSVLIGAFSANDARHQEERNGEGA